MPGTRPIYTVQQLLEEVNSLLEPYHDFLVEGEVTNFTRSGAGHLYFTIKDSKAQLQVVMFAMWARNLKFRVENGQKLVLRGRLKIYEATGKFQLMADSAEPTGIGALQLAFEQLKAKLAAEGLFEKERKKPIPMLPQRIAVVTSPTGAAIRDILNVLGRRFEGLSVQVYPVRVQGATAAREISTALKHLSDWKLHDVVIIARGGGSLEDLWPFNEEIVARAVAACEIPTISGVGHEIDFTICDFAADLRAATPSAAAEIVVRAKSEICEQIDNAVRRIRNVVETSVRHYRSELRHLTSAEGLGAFPLTIERRRERLQRRRLALYHLLEAQAKLLRKRLAAATEPIARFPDRLALKNRMHNIDGLQHRSRQAIRTRLQHDRNALRQLAATLQAVSPLSVLSRGYAIAFAWRGGRLRPLLDSAAVNVGEGIEVQLKKGRLRATVDEKTFGFETVWPESGEDDE